MKFEEKKMVNWYDAKQLATTGIKTVLSGIFGNFADKREFQAAFSPNETFHDFSKIEEIDSDREEIWIDYISDLGDGFNSTYTMAHLMAQEKLDFNGIEAKRGDLLIMGGDEVYPTPEIDEYDNRLKGPYKAAFPWKENDPNRPRLFAIPGNHDWYDGLTNFTKIFFQDRALGNWHTKQKRSYFAIKLPHNYWLIGIDISLGGDVDFPQIEYFRKIARENIKENHKIILCTAEPTWIFRSWADKEKTHDKIEFFINEVLCGKSEDYYGCKDNPAKVVSILTGDLHHYSRYLETNKKNGNIRHLITAGGGGAFTHPTHLLKNEICSEEGNVGVLADCTFPSQSASKNLGWLNLLFPFYCIKIALFFGSLHLLTTWFIQSNPTDTGTFMERSITNVFSANDIFHLVLESISHSPSVAILNVGLLIGLTLFSDNKTNWGNWNFVTGFIHGLLQLAAFYYLFWFLTNLNNALPGKWGVIDTIPNMLVFTLEMVLLGGFITAFVFGLYLLFSIRIAKNHPTEAFSSFRWTGYKNFIRIHIDKNGDATVYAVGVKKVVTNWENISENKEVPKYAGNEIKYQLIEEPFKINES